MLRLPLELSYLTGHLSVSIKFNSNILQYKILTYKFTRNSLELNGSHYNDS